VKATGLFWLCVLVAGLRWPWWCKRKLLWFTFSGEAAMVSSRCRCRNGGDGALLQRERRGCSREDLVTGRRCVLRCTNCYCSATMVRAHVNGGGNVKMQICGATRCRGTSVAAVCVNGGHGWSRRCCNGVYTNL